jgi:hypothetical protein
MCVAPRLRALGPACVLSALCLLAELMLALIRAGFKTINISSGSEVGGTTHERPEPLRSSDREVE